MPPPALPLPAGELAGRLLDWYAEHARDLPWRREVDAYRVWVSEVMLQQTQVAKVIPYYERFLDRFPDLATLAAAGEDEVTALWSGLGYYSRARNLHSAARKIVSNHKGVFPNDMDTALALPGVGRYTAGAVLSIAYSRPVPVLDGNVRRVLARLVACDLEPGKGLDRRLWGLLDEIFRSPTVAASSALLNQSLMELGALVCRPRRPRCRECPLEPSCVASLAGLSDVLPRPRARRSTEEVHFTSALIKRDSRFVMRQNHGESFLQGFWEFPRVPGTASKVVLERDFSGLGLALKVLAVLPPIRHHITYRKILFHPVLARLRGGLPQGWGWVDPADPELPKSSYITKILASVPRKAERPAATAIIPR